MASPPRIPAQTSAAAPSPASSRRRYPAAWVPCRPGECPARRRRAAAQPGGGTEVSAGVSISPGTRSSISPGTGISLGPGTVLSTGGPIPAGGPPPGGKVHPAGRTRPWPWWRGRPRPVWAVLAKEGAACRDAPGARRATGRPVRQRPLLECAPTERVILERVIFGRVIFGRVILECDITESVTVECLTQECHTLERISAECIALECVPQVPATWGPAVRGRGERCGEEPYRGGRLRAGAWVPRQQSVDGWPQRSRGSRPGRVLVRDYG